MKKAERKNIKAQADHRFREMAKETPELKKNALKRYLHKKRIQRQFRKQAKVAAKKGAAAGSKSASLVSKAGKTAVNFIKKNPKVMLLLAMCFLIIVIIQSCTAMTLALFNSLGGGVLGATTYVSEDGDMLGAETAYAGMEVDLQHRLNIYATLNPGYEEYIFELAEIGHDPYVLISIISAFHDGPWTLAEAQSMLTMLFERQYILIVAVSGIQVNNLSLIIH